MAKLAAWSTYTQSGEGGSQPSAPQRVPRSDIGLEKHFEDWIVNDVTMIGEGYTLVGRQVSIDDGRLDLLAIDSKDRWLVIEIKPGRLHAGALQQALYYASSLARLDADELFEKLKPNLGDFGDEKTLSERVKQQLDNEDGEREIAMLLVGAGIHAGLERMNEFLARFRVPVSVVSFDVFRLDDGPQLLIREVVDEPTVPPRQFTVGAIRDIAEKVGVRQQFDRFVKMSERAGLAVQPNRWSVRIAPPQNRTRYLMYARPQRAGANGGELGVSVGVRAFVELFPHLDGDEVATALSQYEDIAFRTGDELNDCLKQIERFLVKHFPQPG